MEERFDNEDTSGGSSGSLGVPAEDGGRTPTALASLGSAKKRERQPSGSSRADARPRRKLKVYGWQSRRKECPPKPNGSRQTREIMAATSKAAVRDKMEGYHKTPASEISETGNDIEIALAMSKPGTIFWQPLGSLKTEPWHEATSARTSH